MCGRYTLKVALSELVQTFGLNAAVAPAPRFNIAPTQSVSVVTNSGERMLETFRWGLVPFWAKDLAVGNRMINARAETVSAKPAFKRLLVSRRCWVLADGFYEWKKEGPRKQPMHIRLKGARPFAFAGLWDEWKTPEGERLRTCTIITTQANSLLAHIHDRMPVILPEYAAEAWLTPGTLTTEELQPLLVPYAAEEMETFPVSARVSSPRNEGAELLNPA